MATATEKLESREVSWGSNSEASLFFSVFDANDEQEARLAVAGQIGTTFDLFGNGLAFLPIDTISVKPVGEDLWDATVRYGKQGGEAASDQPTLTLDTSGGTQKITQSLTTRTFGANAPDINGVIGATKDNVEGVDIIVPAFTFTVTKLRSAAAMSAFYLGLLFDLVGKVNQAAWTITVGGVTLGFERGEVLYKGASGKQRGDGQWELVYQFAASPNVSNLTIGSITNIQKFGHEYLEVRYDESVDDAAHALVKTPVGVYAHQVYSESDLTLLGI